ncbi:Transcriptional repressor, ovate [Carex littledalei]|uniref:Transcription repressor n=1 Tax=Carex littledalei TaxID=544730 RepID=A0A833QUD7_9POAL|nr:Transcriptional repressor, ovate [Carex littledalei]
MAATTTSTKADQTIPPEKENQEEKKRICNNGSVIRDQSALVALTSTNPCGDFYKSMVEMIIEMEIYAWDDLEELLNQFLYLNSPNAILVPVCTKLVVLEVSELISKDEDVKFYTVDAALTLENRRSEFCMEGGFFPLGSETGRCFFI